MQTVLITGGAGFIGSHTVDKFLKSVNHFDRLDLDILEQRFVREGKKPTLGLESWTARTVCSVPWKLLNVFYAR